MQFVNSMTFKILQ